MSTLNVSNISDGTTTVGTSYVVNGSAKAWVKGSSAAALLDSFGVSSGVDNGVGNYTFSFTSSFVNSDYASSATPQSGNDRCATVSGNTASSSTIEIFDASAGTNADNNPHGIYFGDLA